MHDTCVIDLYLTIIFFFNDTPTTEIYTLSLHDALPICNNPSKYADAKFLEKVKGNRVVLHFGGKNRGLMKNITVRDAQWMSSWLSQLSDQQLRDAFRAANYRPDQINMLARAVRERSNELRDLRRAEQIGRLR